MRHIADVRPYDGIPPVRSAPHENQLIAAAPDFAAIAALSERIALPQEITIYEAGATITHYLFPVNGITSLVMDVDGATVEVGTVGPEEMIGLPTLLGIVERRKRPALTD